MDVHWSDWLVFIMSIFVLMASIVVAIASKN